MLPNPIPPPVIAAPIPHLIFDPCWLGRWPNNLADKQTLCYVIFDEGFFILGLRAEKTLFYLGALFKTFKTSVQSYKHFTLINYDSRVVIWGIF